MPQMSYHVSRKQRLTKGRKAQHLNNNNKNIMNSGPIYLNPIRYIKKRAKRVHYVFDFVCHQNKMSVNVSLKTPFISNKSPNLAVVHLTSGILRFQVRR